MTALIADRKTDKLAPEDVAYPVLLKYPVEASTNIYGGALVAINAAGNAVPASAIGALKCVGRAERQCLNQATGGTISPDGIANGNAGSILVTVRQGVYYFNINADSTITKASFGANVYASDDNTVSLSDAGGTRPYAGWIIDPQQTAALGNMNPSTSQVGVFVGVANPYALNPELASFAGQFKARAVVTSLAAYTGTGTGTLTASANGAWAAQDGVTNAVGDIVFIQAGTTNLTGAVDSGPWQISSLGGASAKWILIRPDWWQNGSTMPVGAVIEVGGEGSVYLGTSWKSFAAVGSAVVGTNDPAFYVGRITFAVTLVTGFVKLGPTQSFPGIKSLTTSGIEFTPTNFNGASSTVSYRTGAYASGGSATAAGYMGTATASITALVAAGTFNTSDVSTGLITLVNW
jgi:hypothetical protein